MLSDDGDDGDDGDDDVRSSLSDEDIDALQGSGLSLKAPFLMCSVSSGCLVLLGIMVVRSFRVLIIRIILSSMSLFVLMC